MGSYSDFSYQHLDITLPVASQENDTFRVVQKIRPQWKQSDVRFVKITGGFLNKTYTCLHKDDPTQSDGLFIRINGKNREALERIFINKKYEIRYLKEVNKHRLGTPLLATFNNGIILKYVRGNMVSLKQVTITCLLSEFMQITKFAYSY